MAESNVFVYEEEFERLVQRAVKKQEKGGGVDAFLKIDGIEGESVDSKHPKEVQILAWNWGTSQKGTSGSGSGGAGAGKARVRDFLIASKLDKAYPKAQLACNNGAHVKEMTFTVRKAGETPQDYLVIKLGECIFSEVTMVDSPTDDAIPIAVYGVNFSKYEIEYKEQKADGSLGGSTKVGYDIAKSTKV